MVSNLSVFYPKSAFFLVACLMLQIAVNILIATTARPEIVLRMVNRTIIARFDQLNDTDYAPIKRTVQRIQQAVSCNGSGHVSTIKLIILSWFDQFNNNVVILILSNRQCLLSLGNHTKTNSLLILLFFRATVVESTRNNFYVWHRSLEIQIAYQTNAWSMPCQSLLDKSLSIW